MKRIVALLLPLVLTVALCGCGGEERAAVLCAYEAACAGDALRAAGKTVSCVYAESDNAALQQLQAGATDCALVTAACDPDASLASDKVTLGAFLILSRAGRLSEWDRSTRVTIVGERDGIGAQLAVQALECALYGAVRYEDAQDALEAFSKGKTDVVMGLFAPQDEGVQRALRAKNAALQPMPEELITVETPNEGMEKRTFSIGDNTVTTYVLPGHLAHAQRDSAEAELARAAARQAGLMQ